MTMTTGVSPHIRSGRTTQRVMLDGSIALCPALIASVVIYGFRLMRRLDGFMETSIKPEDEKRETHKKA